MHALAKKVSRMLPAAFLKILPNRETASIFFPAALSFSAKGA